MEEDITDSVGRARKNKRSSHATRNGEIVSIVVRVETVESPEPREDGVLERIAILGSSERR